MWQNVEFTVATGAPIHFCDPHPPWMCGSNGNTNELLRYYLPKCADLSRRSAEDLLRIQRRLSGLPRKTLDDLMPIDKLS
jgi:IS30 family transposase